MEPRITSLLGDPFTLDRNTIETLTNARAPPPTLAPPRPLPVEPSNVATQAPVSKEFAGRDLSSGTFYKTITGPLSALNVNGIHHPPAREGPQKGESRPSKTALPLTEVLNEESQEISFAGSLNDILVDTGPCKRRKVDGNELLTLPKPQPSMKKGSRRPRIPPLLQGLHQPPPNAGLFPPITEEGFQGQLSGRGKAQDAVPATVEPNPAESQPRDEADSKDPTEENGGANGAPKGTKYKKRNKWTEEETTDLLKGVARFGIGSWKKILLCDEYSFNGRTPVDLKDRFRTCCPDEYRKFRVTDHTTATSKRSTAVETSTVENDQFPSNNSLLTGENGQKRKRRTRCDNHRKDTTALALIGINQPFTRTDRRGRHEFTEKEDDSLLLGFERHGPSWISIKSDPQLGFTDRHPTDLRDRFRNRWPEKYAQAGYKIRPREAHKSLVRSKESEAQAQDTTASISTEPLDTPVKAARQNETPPSVGLSSAYSSHLAPEITPWKNLTLSKPLLPGFTDSLLDDQISDNDSYTSYNSPIILSRNIFQWANQNTSAPIPAGVAAVTSSGNLTTATDPTHINPMSLSFLSGVETGISINTLHSLGAMDPPPPVASVNLSSASRATGNLPNLSMALTNNASSTLSASRSSGVNLPRPSEMLTGVDWDMRADKGEPSWWE